MGWPIVSTRQDMLAEAIRVIRELHTGELVTFRGEHFDVDSARIWDVPDGGVPIGVALSGEQGVQELAPLADHLIAVEPDGELVERWNSLADSAIGSGARAVGQIPICWDPSEEAAVERAHEQFRWFAGGWKVNSDLPTPMGFSGASQFVRPEDVARADPLRTRPRRGRRGGQALLGGRLHRRRARAGGRRAPAGVPRRGGRPAAREAARGGSADLTPTTRSWVLRWLPGQPPGHPTRWGRASVSGRSCLVVLGRRESSSPGSRRRRRRPRRRGRSAPRPAC